MDRKVVIVNSAICFSYFVYQYFVIRIVLNNHNTANGVAALSHEVMRVEIFGLATM
jgi:hypothetical protein